ncbi:hypothetical protein TL10_24280 [Mycolicibacterium llatzerense]|uniref:Uncharacterized protein n=2 Tax=Mycolicibacterium llatzerense TaxID=280871 RepID=A0A0D1L0B3_9MYCO|nr:hypothetical protein TL10_24280 [Mycolicibacterium llatzerense]
MSVRCSALHTVLAPLMLGLVDPDKRVAASTGDGVAIADVYRWVASIRMVIADENSRLLADLANALDTARVLLLSDSAKNDLIRPYPYDDPPLGASDLD